jgi:endonuclease-3
MPREAQKARAKRAQRIVTTLFETHPDAHCELRHSSAFDLLCATLLSAQCTDKVVNTVTPELLRRFPDAARMAKARPSEVERIIRPTGFYRNKAKSLIGMARAVLEKHDGQIPKTMEELVRLPGVGRKTANVILGNAFGTPGIVVDTHVARLSNRMALSEQTDPVKIERDLEKLIPEADWTQFSHAMIFHGRRVCAARNPKCKACSVFPDCPFPKRRARKTTVTKRKGKRLRPTT